MSFCRQCGSELSKGTKFCGSCGARVVVEEQQPLTSPVEEMGHSAKNTKSKLKYWGAWRIFLAFIVVAMLSAGIIVECWHITIFPHSTQPSIVGTWRYEKSDKSTFTFYPDGSFSATDLSFNGPKAGKYTIHDGNYITLKFSDPDVEIESTFAIDGDKLTLHDVGRPGFNYDTVYDRIQN